MRCVECGKEIICDRFRGASRKTCSDECITKRIRRQNREWHRIDRGKKLSKEDIKLLNEQIKLMIKLGVKHENIVSRGKESESN